MRRRSQRSLITKGPPPRFCALWPRTTRLRPVRQIADRADSVFRQLDTEVQGGISAPRQSGKTNSLQTDRVRSCKRLATHRRRRQIPLSSKEIRHDCGVTLSVPRENVLLATCMLPSPADWTNSGAGSCTHWNIRNWFCLKQKSSHRKWISTTPTYRLRSENR